MKVIVAGLSKTGTKSMADALRMLGYSVYDYMENYEYLHKDWEKIFAGDGTTDDFRRMYKDVDAITDTPAAYFWDEIHKAFPDAKIILTTRDNEERWFKSLKVQGDQVRDALNPLWYLSPTYQNFRSYTNNNGLAAYGTPWYETMQPINRIKTNEMYYRKAYRCHNAYVLQTAPKDKLLVYNVKQGWEPLCKFLEVKTPSEPFPHINAGGKMVADLYRLHPTFIRARREIMIALAIIGVLISCFCYSFYALFLS